LVPISAHRRLARLKMFISFLHLKNHLKTGLPNP
jgi:hypothetical protein